MSNKNNNKPAPKNDCKPDRKDDCKIDTKGNDKDRNDRDHDRDNGRDHHNNDPKDCKPTPPPAPCKPTPPPVVCKPVKDDCRNDRDDDRNHGGKDRDCGPKKPNIWDCDNGFWGKPHCGTPVCTTVEKPHTFTGNLFPTLVEGQALTGAALASLGQSAANMAINANTTINGVITFESADYQNSLGVFTITSDGTIGAVEMAVKNTDNIGATFQIDAGAGAKEIGFFLSPDGFTRFGGYDAYDIDAGSLKFVTNYGTPGASATKVTDDGTKVSMIFTTSEGEDVVVPGPFWFTSDRGGSNSLNTDGMVHTVSGVDAGDNKSLIIAFEDKPSLYSDKDYNDTIFKVTMTDEVKVCCDTKPSCEPTPPPCEPTPPPCKPVVDFCDPITKAISDFVHNATSKAAAYAFNDEGHTTAAAVLGIAGAQAQTEDQSAYNVVHG